MSLDSGYQTYKTQTRFKPSTSIMSQIQTRPNSDCMLPKPILIGFNQVGYLKIPNLFLSLSLRTRKSKII